MTAMFLIGILLIIAGFWCMGDNPLFGLILCGFGSGLLTSM